MTLTEFLLARVAEDEDRIIHEFDCDRFNVYDYGSRYGECDCNATSRLLAECEAKRLIVEDYTLADADYKVTRGEADEVRRLAALLALTRVALPYADHPDYRDEWRP